jgi:alkylation response protein AidB-like acyl-CoA dehydrogenase
MQSKEDFASAVRAFLGGSAAAKDSARDPARDMGSDRIALNVVASKPRWQDDAECKKARVWRARLDDAGLAWISGPLDCGGAGLPEEYERIFRDLEAGYDVPDSGYTRVGVVISTPTIMKFGSPEFIRRWMPGIRRGVVLVCQLFSEPGAGSDLAGTSTKAVRNGDDWVITGQKVWTSGGRNADMGLCIAVTDRGAGRHRNLSMFMVDMHAPGVTVRPLRQMSGGAEFCEVFLDDVRVPDRDRLGAEGTGWAVAMDILVNERASLGDDLLPDDSLVERLLGLAKVSAAGKDPVVRSEVIKTLVHFRVMRVTADRFMDEVRSGRRSSVSFSLLKLGMTENLQRLSHTVGRLLGPALVADNDEWGTYCWAEFVLGVPGMRLGGGTDEVMRTVVAETVLGMPKEPRPGG